MILQRKITHDERRDTNSLSSVSDVSSKTHKPGGSKHDTKASMGAVKGRVSGVLCIPVYPNNGKLKIYLQNTLKLFPATCINLFGAN